MAERDAVPTRSALLELQDEARFTREGHELIDQKRMLLAAEILRWLARYQTVEHEFLRAHERARRALAEAIALHGIGVLAHHPPGRAALAGESTKQSFLGVPTVVASGSAVLEPASAAALDPSPQARRTGKIFGELIRLSVELATLRGNVRRLADEYRRAERRARALENVILPDLSNTIRHIEEHLEEQDFEEAARLRS